jgi:hypothetical protein
MMISMVEYPTMRLHEGAFSAVKNNSVLAAKSKCAVSFYVNGVARFTFFGREDRFDSPYKLIAGEWSTLSPKANFASMGKILR